MVGHNFRAFLVEISINLSVYSRYENGDILVGGVWKRGIVT